MSSPGGLARSSWPRKIRLVSGCVLFAYVLGHLCNLALGLHSLAVMDAARPFFMAPWVNPVGLFVLYGAVLVHMTFGLEALFRRRTLRMTGYDGVQLLMALALPPLIVIHILGTRGAATLVDYEPSYAMIMLFYWKWFPVNGLRQVLVVMTAWIHGCMGIYYWMRLQPWWPSWRGFLYPLAFVVPVVSLLGFVEAGKEVIDLSTDPRWMALRTAQTANIDKATVAWIASMQTRFLTVYAGVVLAVLAARAWKIHRHGRADLVQVNYAHGPVARAERGLSLLEISRANDIAHASLCGGRGRCGTCRVRIEAGAVHLPEPAALETETLTRIKAAPDVRLACQAVPRSSPITVERLVPVDVEPMEAISASRYGRRAELVVMGARARGLSSLTRDREPQDAFFVLNRYLSVIRTRIESAGGTVERIDADGVRAVFGIDEPQAGAARRALELARTLRSSELRDETGLDLDVWIHLGEVLVGELGLGEEKQLGFMGEGLAEADRLGRLVGNHDGVLAVSEALATKCDLGPDEYEVVELDSTGPQNTPLRVWFIDQTHGAAAAPA
ncbi:MAG: 2Fe-2S iron-sulfur cluster-binding protein [Gammaproteobacteria bacterium]